VLYLDLKSKTILRKLVFTYLSFHTVDEKFLQARLFDTGVKIHFITMFIFGEFTQRTPRGGYYSVSPREISTKVKETGCVSL
jgi:hypothetical protein